MPNHRPISPSTGRPAPSAASGAEPLSIEWTGPGNPGDYIDVVPAGFAATSGEIAYAYTASGNAVKFSAPGAAGAYEVRYVIEGPGGATAEVELEGDLDAELDEGSRFSLAATLACAPLLTSLSPELPLAGLLANLLGLGGIDRERVIGPATGVRHVIGAAADRS